MYAFIESREAKNFLPTLLFFEYLENFRDRPISHK